MVFWSVDSVINWCWLKLLEKKGKGRSLGQMRINKRDEWCAVTFFAEINKQKLGQSLLARVIYHFVTWVCDVTVSSAHILFNSTAKTFRNLRVRKSTNRIQLNVQLPANTILKVIAIKSIDEPLAFFFWISSTNHLQNFPHSHSVDIFSHQEAKPTAIGTIDINWSSWRNK